jgi:hypothetical protein
MLDAKGESVCERHGERGGGRGGGGERGKREREMGVRNHHGRRACKYTQHAPKKRALHTTHAPRKTKNALAYARAHTHRQIL